MDERRRPAAAFDHDDRVPDRVKVPRGEDDGGFDGAQDGEELGADDCDDEGDDDDEDDADEGSPLLPIFSAAHLGL